MSGYKLMYNTPDGGKGSLGLMKNYAFNNSMCDGIYLQQKVPPSTTETELFICQGSAKLDSAGTILAQDPFMCVYVTKPVDEYITVVINFTVVQVWGDGSTAKSSMVFILPPQQTFTFSNTAITWTAFCTFNDVYIYVGKRLAYKFEGDTECKKFKDTYFGARKVTGDTTENTHKGFPLTCNNENLYVYPLCKDFKIENDGDNKISSIHLPAFRYKDEIYYPMIKISGEKNDALNKFVNYVPTFIGNAFKEEYNLKDEDISAENTSGLGDISGDSLGPEFNPDDFDFTPPKFEGGLTFPENTFTEVTKEIVKESTTTAVKDTFIVEEKTIEDTGGSGSGDTIKKEFTVISGEKWDVKGGFKAFLYDLAGSMVEWHSIKRIPIYNSDGTIKSTITQILDEDGEVVATTIAHQNQIDDLLSNGGTLIEGEDGTYTYIDGNTGDITIVNKDGTSDYYENTGGINNLGHEVYYGPDGFPVYIWTDPDTGEKVFM